MNLFPAKALFFTFLVICLASCASRSDIAYLQNADNYQGGQAVAFEPTLQPDDLLSIIVSATTPEVTVPFNLPQIQGNYEVNNNQNGIKTYLVDNAGFIDFPVIGRIKLAGLTRTEAKNKLTAAISEFITDPSINLRILNYKIAVIGEVGRPGTFRIDSERLTLFEALSLAGDLTIYGRRDNILIIREVDGLKSFHRVDITQADFIDSPFYYLKQNDQLVIEPNKTRMNASVYGQNLSFILSAASLALTMGLIIFR
jgi:polysaccharide export outer membrane protein